MDKHVYEYSEVSASGTDGHTLVCRDNRGIIYAKFGSHDGAAIRLTYPSGRKIWCDPRKFPRYAEVAKHMEAGRATAVTEAAKWAKVHAEKAAIEEAEARVFTRVRNAAPAMLKALQAMYDVHVIGVLGQTPEEVARIASDALRLATEE